MVSKSSKVAVVVAVLVLTGGVAGFVSAESPDAELVPSDKPSESESYEAQAANTMASAPTGEWDLIADDPVTENLNIGIDSVYVQEKQKTLYFRYVYDGDLAAHDDVDSGTFIDVDRNVSTGLNNSTSDWYYMDDIGADYVAVVGYEGDSLWKWENNTWRNVSQTPQLSYVDFNYESDSVVIGIDRGKIGNPETVDLLFGNAQTDPWEWVPDKGEGHITYHLNRSNTSDGTDSPGDVTENGQAATDTDNDGRYEDITGDGHVDARDVLGLWNQRRNLQPEYFDFTDDGSVDARDVLALWNKL